MDVRFAVTAALALSLSACAADPGQEPVATAGSRASSSEPSTTTMPSTSSEPSSEPTPEESPTPQLSAAELLSEYPEVVEANAMSVSPHGETLSECSQALGFTEIPEGPALWGVCPNGEPPNAPSPIRELPGASVDELVAAILAGTTPAEEATGFGKEPAQADHVLEDGLLVVRYSPETRYDSLGSHEGIAASTASYLSHPEVERVSIFLGDTPMCIDAGYVCE